MSSNLVRIKFQFPQVPHGIKTDVGFVDFLLKAMRKNGDVKYAGYAKEKDLKDDLSRHLVGWSPAQYKPPSTKERGIVKKTIMIAVKKCQRALPHPDLPIFVFIYPWLPNADDRILFQGNTAVASYRTIHLFIDLNTYTREALEQTVAHEWNHLVFYQYHPEQHVLRTHIIMEGLAEVFREEIMGGKPAPWAIALNKKEAERQLRIIKGKLDAPGMKIYKEVFLEGRKYKRWTGYAIGYSLAKKFRKVYPNLSWESIMKLDSEKYYE
jgi:uncharacterized protein YjaZ